MRFIIDLLTLEKGKAYGFHEYVFNLLNYFYNHRGDICYSKIVIWCKESEKELFSHFNDKLEIEGFKYSSYVKKHWLQTFLPFKYGLNKEDLLFSPGNISGIVRCSSEILTIHDLLFKRKDPSGRGILWLRVNGYWLTINCTAVYEERRMAA